MHPPGYRRLGPWSPAFPATWRRGQRARQIDTPPRGRCVEHGKHPRRTRQFAGPTGTRLEKVGQTMRFTKGTYRITMVRQAKNDNVLTLIVK
jgi:hypothetical protein